jgi:anti-anti-sigma factor
MANSPSGPDSTTVSTADAALALTIDLVGDVQVIHASGRLDTVTTEQFDARIQQVVVPGAARVVLDLAHVTYVSSAGLRSLLTLLKRVKSLDGSLVLAAVHPRVVDILEIAGFTPLFVLAATPDAALAALQTPR